MPTDALFPRILDVIDEGVIAVDTEFRITYLNAAAERITGRSSQEALGQRCFAVVRSSACADACPMQQTLRTGEPSRGIETTLRDSQGRPVDVRLSTAAVRDASGGLIAGLEVVRDVSEIEALRRTQVPAEAAGTPPELVGLLERALSLCRETPTEVLEPPPVPAIEPTAAWEEFEVVGEPVAVVAEVPAGSLRPSEHRALAAAREATGEPNTPLADAEIGRPEVQALVDVLDTHHWNRNATAEALGISRGTLWRRMKEYGLI